MDILLLYEQGYQSCPREVIRDFVLSFVLVDDGRLGVYTG